MPKPSKHSRAVRTASRDKAAEDTSKAFQDYLKKWSVDPSGEQQESWTILKKALQENRSGFRKLFRD